MASLCHNDIEASIRTGYRSLLLYPAEHTVRFRQHIYFHISGHIHAVMLATQVSVDRLTFTHDNLDQLRPRQMARLARALLALLPLFTLTLSNPISVHPIAPCAQVCHDNVMKIGFSGCMPGDTGCACKSPDFGYALRDCAAQSCGSNDTVPQKQLLSWGAAVCQAGDDPQMDLALDLTLPN